MAKITKQSITSEQLSNMKKAENRIAHIQHNAMNNEDISYNALLFRETFLSFAKQSGIPEASKYFYDFWGCSSKEYDNVIANGYMGEKFRSKLESIGLKEEFYTNHNTVKFPTSTEIEQLVTNYLDKDKTDNLSLSDFRLELAELLFFNFDEKNKDLIELARRMMQTVFTNHFDDPNGISELVDDLYMTDFDGTDITQTALYKELNQMATAYHDELDKTGDELKFSKKSTNLSSQSSTQNLQDNLTVIREAYLILSKQQYIPDAENKFYTFLNTTKEIYDESISNGIIDQNLKQNLLLAGIPKSCFDSKHNYLLYMSEAIYNACQYAESNPPLFHALFETNLLYVPNGDNALLLLLVRQMCRRIIEEHLTPSERMEQFKTLLSECNE